MQDHGSVGDRHECTKLAEFREGQKSSFGNVPESFGVSAVERRIPVSSSLLPSASPYFLSPISCKQCKGSGQMSSGTSSLDNSLAAPPLVRRNRQLDESSKSALDREGRDTRDDGRGECSGERRKDDAGSCWMAQDFSSPSGSEAAGGQFSLKPDCRESPDYCGTCISSVSLPLSSEEEGAGHRTLLLQDGERRRSCKSEKPGASFRLFGLRANAALREAGRSVWKNYFVHLFGEKDDARQQSDSYCSSSCFAQELSEMEDMEQPTCSFHSVTQNTDSSCPPSSPYTQIVDFNNSEETNSTPSSPVISSASQDRQTSVCRGCCTSSFGRRLWRLTGCSKFANWLSSKRSKVILSLYTLGLLLSSVMNSIYFKKMTDAMPNYSWFLSQLTTSVYIPVFFTIVLYTYYTGNISQETTSFPKHRFLGIGSLDSLSGIMMILGGVHTSGTTQVVLQQAIIPITLLASVVILRARYHWLQYVGAVVIILGVLIAKFPDFTSHGNGDVQNIFVFNVIFLLGGVPTALSSVYKEVAFTDVDLDVNYLQGWVALFQLLVGFLIVPINTLPILQSQRIAWSDMPGVLINGSKCLFAQTNSITSNCGGPAQPPCDDCPYSWIPVFTYLLFNVFYNLYTVLVIKHGSAALCILIATLKLPLTSFAFYSSYIMGSNAVQPRSTDFYALAVLLLGLAGYRYGGVLRKRTTTYTAAADDTEILPVFANIIEAEPLFVRVHKHKGGADHIRANYYYKLRVATPLHSPALSDCLQSFEGDYGELRESEMRFPTPASPSHSLLSYHNHANGPPAVPPMHLTPRAQTPEWFRKDIRRRWEDPDNCLGDGSVSPLKGMPADSEAMISTGQAVRGRRGWQREGDIRQNGAGEDFMAAESSEGSGRIQDGNNCGIAVSSSSQNNQNYKPTTSSFSSSERWTGATECSSWFGSACDQDRVVPECRSYSHHRTRGHPSRYRRVSVTGAYYRVGQAGAAQTVATSTRGSGGAGGSRRSSRESGYIVGKHRWSGAGQHAAYTIVAPCSPPHSPPDMSVGRAASPASDREQTLQMNDNTGPGVSRYSALLGEAAKLDFLLPTYVRCHNTGDAKSAEGSKDWRQSGTNKTSSR